MPKYLDPDGVAYLWSKIKNISQHNFVYYSKTTDEWNRTPLLLSEKNALYIYTDHKKTLNEKQEEVYVPGLKLGDGKAYLIDLPFLNDSDSEYHFLEHIHNKVIHVDTNDRTFWDNKLNVEIQNENLILTTG